MAGEIEPVAISILDQLIMPVATGLWLNEAQKATDNFCEGSKISEYLALTKAEFNYFKAQFKLNFLLAIIELNDPVAEIEDLLAIPSNSFAALRWFAYLKDAAIATPVSFFLFSTGIATAVKSSYQQMLDVKEAVSDDNQDVIRTVSRNLGGMWAMAYCTLGTEINPEIFYRHVF